MIFSIPWYVVLFESLPETMLIVITGLRLFGLTIDLKKLILVSAVSAILVYYIRSLHLFFGIHTIFGVLLLTFMTAIIVRIPIWQSFICILTGMVTLGIVQLSLLPIIFKLTSTTVSDLTPKPWLNVIYFIPIGLVMLAGYLIIKKQRFVLAHFGSGNLNEPNE